jgi:hypothetical protein
MQRQHTMTETPFHSPRCRNETPAIATYAEAEEWQQLSEIQAGIEEDPATY